MFHQRHDQDKADAWLDKPKSTQPKRYTNYHASDNLSWDDDSQEAEADWVAQFPAREKQPAASKPDLNQQYLTLLTAHPDCALDIQALAYYYGLIPPEEDETYAPQYDRYLRFFNPQQDHHPVPAVNAFCASLAAAKNV